MDILLSRPVSGDSSTSLKVQDLIKETPKYVNYFLTTVYFLTTRPTISSTGAPWEAAGTGLLSHIHYPAEPQGEGQRQGGRKHMGLLQLLSDRSTGNAVVNWSPGFVSEGALASVLYLVLA